MSLKVRKIVSMIIGVLLLTYVGYQIFTVNKKKISVELAAYGAVSDTLQVDNVLIIRDESIISAEYDGVLSYNVADGGKISKGGIIAEIYPEEKAAAARNNMDEIDAELARILSLTAVTDQGYTDPDLLGTQINDAVVGMLKARISSNFTQITPYKHEFLTGISKKNILTGKETKEELEARYDQLFAKRTELDNSSARSSGAIEAERAGYFMYSPDGYETVYSTEKIEELTPAAIKKLLSAPPKQTPENAVGKLCSEFSWYLVCVISEQESVQLYDIHDVNIEIPFAAGGKIPVQIIGKNRDMKTNEVALIMRCDYMDADLLCLRNESIKIESNVYSGVLVKEKSIHYENVEEIVQKEDGTEEVIIHEDVKGVYVKRGTQMEFVQIFSDKSIGGYAICKVELDKSELEALVTRSSIRLYDEIITEGSGLYDGKFV